MEDETAEKLVLMKLYQLEREYGAGFSDTMEHIGKVVGIRDHVQLVRVYESLKSKGYIESLGFGIPMILTPEGRHHIEEILRKEIGPFGF